MKNRTTTARAAQIQFFARRTDRPRTTHTAGQGTPTSREVL